MSLFVRLVMRFLWGLITIVAVYTLTFVMVISLPGNPFQSGDRSMAPQIVEAMRARYSMDNDWLYYWEFLRGALQFDFGPSFTYIDWSCAEIILAALPVSMTVGALAILLALLVGIPLGVFGAMNRGGFWDRATSLLVLGSLAVPTFVVGSFLLIIFGVMLSVAPIGGWGTLSHLPLPVITLSVPYAAYIARLTRDGLTETLQAEFVRTALAKGMTMERAMLRHALKPALLPVLSFLGPALAQAMTGSFVVEKIFSIPGLGQHFVNAALNLDSGLILGTVLVFSSLLVVMNIIVDLLYAFFDPRIRGSI
ncbi:MAG: ABC transporter permease [Phycisphaerae bacterium]